MKKIILAFSLIAFSLNTQAQTKDSLFKSQVAEILDIPVKQENELVTSASQVAESLSDVPAQIIIITAEQIKERGYNDLSDLLRDMPAMDITNNARAFGEYYTVRGINGNDRFLVMLNGRKLNAISGTLLSVGNSIALQFAKKVEIVYGAASIVYGTDAFSCVINIITDENVVARKTDIRFSVGNFNTKDISVHSQTKINKNLSINAFGRSFSSDGFSPDATNSLAIISTYKPPLSNKFEQPIKDYNIYFEATYKNFKAGYFRQHFNEGNSWGITPAIYVYSKDAAWIVNHDIYWLNYRKVFSNGATLNTDISYNTHTQEPDSQFPKFTANNNAASPLFVQYMTGLDKSMRALTQYSRSMLKIIDFMVGFQYDYANIIPAYANDHVLGVPSKYIGSMKQTIQDSLTINEQKMGTFSQMRFNFSPKINFTAGFRYDISKQFDESLNPRLALIYKPTNHLFAKLIFASAFQAPSFFSVYEQFGNVNVVMLPNTKQDFHLDNQRVQTFEFDLTYNKKNINLNLNAYYSLADNLIERRLYSNKVYNPYAGKETNGFRNENIGKQTVLGFTARLEWQIHKNISLWTHYAYTKATFIAVADKQEHFLPRVSEHKVFLSSTFRQIFKKMNAHISWQYTPNTYATLTSKEGKIEGYHAVNINLTSIKIKNFRIFTNSQFIFGNKEQVGLYDGGNYLYTIPQAPWQGKIGIEISF